MVSSGQKELFFTVMGPLMRLNGWLYRRLRAPSGGIVKVHLGPGREKYLEGWLNLDCNMFTGRCDVWVDLRNALPFRDGSVDVFYSHHVIEHLPDQRRHFSEIRRCLKPGGIYRVGGPNGDSAIRKFTQGDAEWFGDFPEKRRSLGGRLENFLLCGQQHKSILTFSFLQELMEDEGLVDIRKCRSVTETNFPEYFDDRALQGEWETTEGCPHTLIVECRKPRG